jgi:hypothetical protein
MILRIAPMLRATEVLKKLRVQNDDQKTGVEIVCKALSWPARQIAINAGEDGSVIVGKILEKDQYAYGFDAQNGEYVNMLSKGIIESDQGHAFCVAERRVGGLAGGGFRGGAMSGFRAALPVVLATVITGPSARSRFDRRPQQLAAT